MKTEQALEIQAHADGQLDAGRRAEVERWLREDAKAASLQSELIAVRQAVRAHEPAGTVPDTREFYWSQIQRRIAAEEAVNARGPKPLSLVSWIRWLAPALGVAALAVIVTMRSSASGDLADATVLTFRSDSDRVTIHWIN
jgi:anti-sigma factor RsiW